jgi:hypothetical protein
VEDNNMIFKQNTITNGLFYRIDKNLNNGKSTIRKLVKQSNGSYTVTIPPVIVDMIKTMNLEMNLKFDIDGKFEGIILKPIKETKKVS